MLSRYPWSYLGELVVHESERLATESNTIPINSTMY